MPPAAPPARAHDGQPNHYETPLAVYGDVRWSPNRRQAQPLGSADDSRWERVATVSFKRQQGTGRVSGSERLSSYRRSSAGHVAVETRNAKHRTRPIGGSCRMPSGHERVRDAQPLVIVAVFLGKRAQPSRDCCLAGLTTPQRQPIRQVPWSLTSGSLTTSAGSGNGPALRKRRWATPATSIGRRFRFSNAQLGSRGFLRSYGSLAHSTYRPASCSTASADATRTAFRCAARRKPNPSQPPVRRRGLRACARCRRASCASPASRT
jgi:hypothetical protein